MIADFNKLKLLEGDGIKVNIKCFDENDHLIDLYSKENVDIILGSNSFLPNFDSNLINKKYMLKYEFNYQFDQNFSDEKVKDKNVKFVLDLQEYEPKQFLQLKLNYAKCVQDILAMKIEMKKLADSKVVERLTVPQEEIDKQKKFALQKFLDDFLNPYTTLKVASESGKNSDNPLVQNYVMGFDMVIGMIDSVLKDHGVSIIKPQVGEIFNADTSKIIEVIEDKTVEPNSILKVNSIGFKLYDRLIKPALVVVSKNTKQIQKNKPKKKKRKNTQKIK
ncbi:nucleotide exchange factor GrpE [Mycoplasmopsis lipofaciens]|uniref:nucleotide exchange factor GrpE n=1 Tax=Mycoplasmopsis lipofaciens TaxID=114884 RepID=UPI0004848D05|nr:nucleotide exchange factor GrpE [Mycoplasmopsis lipofaciens]